MKAAGSSSNPRSSFDGGATGARHGRRSSIDGRPPHQHQHHRGASAPSGCDAAAAGPRLPGGGGSGEWPPLLGQRPPARSARCERFQQWLRLLLFQLMSTLAAAGSGASEGAWAAALSCLLHLSTHSGRVVRAHVEELPLSVVAALLEQSRRHRWSEQLHAWLVTLAANLLYEHNSDGDNEVGSMQRSLKAGSLTDSYRSGGGSGSVHRGSAAAAPGAAELSWWAGSRLDPDRLAAFGGMRQVRKGGWWRCIVGLTADACPSKAAVLRHPPPQCCSCGCPAAAPLPLQVLLCYREAPTQLARRSMFCVLYDHVVSGQVGGLKGVVGMGRGCSQRARCSTYRWLLSAVQPIDVTHSSNQHRNAVSWLLLQKPGGPDAWAPALLHHAHRSEAAALGAALLRMGGAEASHPLFLAGVSGGMQHLADAVSLQVGGLAALWAV